MPSSTLDRSSSQLALNRTSTVGAMVGKADGAVVGPEVVGDAVGRVLGNAVGWAVGPDEVGALLGAWVEGAGVVGAAYRSEVAYALRLRRLLPEEHCQIPVPYPQANVAPAAELSAAMLAEEHWSMPPELHAKSVPSAPLIRLAHSQSQP